MIKKNIRDRVIDTLIIRSTLNGALQRARIYKDELTSKQKKTFRISLSAELDRTLKAIISKDYYEDTNHYQTIEFFSNEISAKHKEILINERLRIGTSQKLINLYWKMNWLLKENIKKPLHCPFDSVVIKNLGASVKDISWTIFDDLNDYTRLVEAAYKKDKSIADWEVDLYIKNINYDEEL